MNLQAQRLQVLCEGLSLPGLEVEYEALASLSFIQRNENIVLLGCGENPRRHCIRVSGSIGRAQNPFYHRG